MDEKLSRTQRRTPRDKQRARNSEVAEHGMTREATTRVDDGREGGRRRDEREAQADVLESEHESFGEGGAQARREKGKPRQPWRGGGRQRGG